MVIDRMALLLNGIGVRLPLSEACLWLPVFECSLVE